MKKKSVTLLKPDYFFEDLKKYRKGVKRVNQATNRSRNLEFNKRITRKFIASIKTFKKLSAGDEDAIKEYVEDVKRRCSEK